MFQEVGAFDAKAKLSELLREVGLGQCFTITLRGKPIADLVPSDAIRQLDIKAAVAAMRTFKKVRGVKASDVQHMIVEGRQ